MICTGCKTGPLTVRYCPRHSRIWTSALHTAKWDWSRTYGCPEKCRPPTLSTGSGFCWMSEMTSSFTVVFVTLIANNLVVKKKSNELPCITETFTLECFFDNLMQWTRRRIILEVGWEDFSIVVFVCSAENIGIGSRTLLCIRFAVMLNFYVSFL